ncbi:MAG: pyridoxamine 5'-phosphate oxidase family protein [Actinomycetota bacterium]
MSEPRASRPTPDWLGGEELLPWTWAEENLAAERNYWLVSARRDGFPQARPLWGVWLDGSLFLSVGHAGLQRAGRLDGVERRVTVHVDDRPHQRQGQGLGEGDRKGRRGVLSGSGAVRPTLGADREGD